MTEPARDIEPQGHLDLLTQALESGRLSPVRRLVNSLNSAEIADLLEALPLAKRQLVWNLVDVEYDGRWSAPRRGHDASLTPSCPSSARYTSATMSRTRTPSGFSTRTRA